MKSKLDLMQSESGWMVVEIEDEVPDCATVLVDNLPTKAEAQACMKRLNEYADRLGRTRCSESDIWPGRGKMTPVSADAPRVGCSPATSRFDA